MHGGQNNRIIGRIQNFIVRNIGTWNVYLGPGLNQVKNEQQISNDDQQAADSGHTNSRGEGRRRRQPRRRQRRR